MRRGIEVVTITSPAHLPRLHADRYTAIVVMFHDHEWETRLLPLILETDAFYVGAMGSRKTHARRLENLARSGVEPKQLDRIRGPAGLFESGKSASSIAVSILAEVMQTSGAAGINTVLLSTKYNLPRAISTPTAPRNPTSCSVGHG
jgi:xanthine dehydrogenase accessory factor